MLSAIRNPRLSQHLQFRVVEDLKLCPPTVKIFGVQLTVSTLYLVVVKRVAQFADFLLCMAPVTSRSPILNVVIRTRREASNFRDVSWYRHHDGWRAGGKAGLGLLRGRRVRARNVVSFSFADSLLSDLVTNVTSI